MFSKLSYKFISIIVAAISIASIVVYFNNSKYPSPEREIFLIPDGYTGIFYIIFNNQSLGKPLPYEKDARVYEIPKNGVLVTSADDTCCGTISQNDVQFYYVKPDGTRTRLAHGDTGSIQDTQETRQDTEVKVFGYGSQRQSFIPNKRGENCEIKSTSLLVGSTATLLEGVKEFELKDYVLENMETCK